MPFLPNQWDTWAVAGSQWSATFQLRNDDGTVMNVEGKTFEFVVRKAVGPDAERLLAVTPAATEQGYITVNPIGATLQVVLSAAATEETGKGAWPFALWMNPGLPDATALVVGTFTSNLVAEP